MRNNFNTLLKYIQQSIEAIEQFKGSKEVKLIHHDDADGITAASILKFAFTTRGYQVTTICLEKLFPQAIKMIHKRSNNIIVYADIASPHAKLINEIDKGNSLIIILDHHDAPEFFSDNLYNINPEFFGFSGESEVSGSTIAYIFSKKLVGNIIEKFSHLALIGCYEIPGAIKGLNEIPLRDARKKRLVIPSKKGDYLVKTSIGYKPRSYLSKILTVLASVGYYKNGPSKGIDICLNNFPHDMMKEVEVLENVRRKAFSKLLNILSKKGFYETEFIQWFTDEEIFSDMGTKVIGTFCSYLVYRFKLTDPMKYLLGFMRVKPIIPGLGKLDVNYSKVSVRVSDELKQLIDNKQRPSAIQILEKNCEKFGGFADGHAYAASGVIVAGYEKDLVLSANNIVKYYVCGKKSDITRFF